MSEHIKATTEDGVTTLTIARADKKNALTVDMYVAMVETVRAFNEDDGARVLHLRGEGGSFTAGNDLMDFMNTPPAGKDSPVIQFLISLTECEKPIVVEVSGAAIGIGVTMLLHCDLVYADETATFRMPFVDLGLVPEGASSLLLPRMMGFQKAGELFYLSKKFGVGEAEQVGLVTAIIEQDDLAAHCKSVVAQLAKKAPAAVRKTKDLLRRHTRADVARVLEEEGELFMEQLQSAEAREAFTAFFEKREPDFTKAE